MNLAAARAMYARQFARQGETVTFTLSGTDYPVRVRVSGYEPHELVNGIKQGDRKVIALAADIPVAPKANDRIKFASGSVLNIEAIDDTTRCVGGELVAYEITARGGRIRVAVAPVIPATFSPSLDFSDARNSQYLPLLGVIGGASSSVPSLDFSAANNSQYLPMIGL